MINLGFTLDFWWLMRIILINFETKTKFTTTIESLSYNVIIPYNIRHLKWSLTSSGDMFNLKLSRSSGSGKSVSQVFGRVNSVISMMSGNNQGLKHNNSLIQLIPFVIRNWAAVCLRPPAAPLPPVADVPLPSFCLSFKLNSLIMVNFSTNS